MAATMAGATKEVRGGRQRVAGDGAEPARNE
jgi:hypothetical protein